MNYITSINCVSNDLIYGIISKDEYLIGYRDNIFDKNNLVLISIHEPNKLVHPDSKVEGFVDVLQVQFWDTEHDFKDIPTIPVETAQRIREFIEKHRDKRFLIHCAAGISRSAGVGMAVECIVNYNGNVYEYMTGYSAIKEHERYMPNRVVFDRIVKN